MAAGAQMVKLEGGAEFADTIRFPQPSRGVPVVRPPRPHAAIGAPVSAATACKAKVKTPSRS